MAQMAQMGFGVGAATVTAHWALHHTFTCEGSDFSGLTTLLLWKHL